MRLSKAWKSMAYRYKNETKKGVYAELQFCLQRIGWGASSTLDGIGHRKMELNLIRARRAMEDQIALYPDQTCQGIKEYLKNGWKETIGDPKIKSPTPSEEAK